VRFRLSVWRQAEHDAPGHFESYEVADVAPDESFLEMMDALNDRLIVEGGDAIAFDHDCREGICGACSMTIDGRPHGPGAGTTCQVYMRSFEDGASITVEPFGAAAFPVIKDLIVDRSALDRIQQAGGYTGVNATCIGCGACVAACPNGAAMLFTGAKITHLAHLPQGQPGRYARVQDMVEQMDAEGFGGCTNFGECEAACPKEISIRVIGRMNRDYLLGVLYHPRNPRGGMKPQ
jgi:succinate dehydrogenase / fumarate reductase, iron-sulfur subunit